MGEAPLTEERAQAIRDVFRETNARIWCVLYDFEFRHWDGEFCCFTDRKGPGIESHIPQYAVLSPEYEIATLKDTANG